MTPKEEAKSLVTEFSFQIRGESDYFSDAKKCALITVDKILNCIGSNIFSEYKYWQEVKQEIEKL